MPIKRKPPEAMSFPVWLLYLLLRQEKCIYVDGYRLVIHTIGYLQSKEQHISVGSKEWLEWIDRNTRFNFSNDKTHCLFQKERRRNRYYWYAYKWHKSNHKAERVYVGKLAELSPKEIIAKAMELERMAQFTRDEIARRKRLMKGRSTRRRRQQAQVRERIARTSMTGG